jgi:hypothetical protein
VLTVKFLTGTFAAATTHIFTVSKFTNPTYGQDALNNIAAATSNALSATPVVYVDTTNTGFFPLILGSAGPPTPASTPNNSVLSEGNTPNPSKSGKSTHSLSLALFFAIFSLTVNCF